MKRETAADAPARDAGPASADEPAARKSIAVLPFVNMSSDPEQEYFSDGLSEEILNLLAKIRELRVIGRTSCFSFKGKNEDLREIGKALGVSTVLEGSVRKSGDRVRVTAQLIDVADGAHIWSDTYDRTMTDIFEVQDSVAAAIIGALEIHVGAVPTRGRPTENAEAYAIFLKARAAMSDYKLVDAELLLLEATGIDPEFAKANQLLAHNHWMQTGGKYEPADAQIRMHDAAVRALAVDPSLVFAEALRVAGIQRGSLSQLAEIEAMERAVREEPGNAGAQEALHILVLQSGYFGEDLSLVERFIESDPLSATAHICHYQAFMALGRIPEASRSLKLAGELGGSDPHLSGWRSCGLRCHQCAKPAGQPTASGCSRFLNGTLGGCEGSRA